MIARLLGLVELPDWVRHVVDVLAGVLLLAIIVGFWLRAHDNAVIDKHEAKVSQQVQTMSSAGAADASAVVAQSKQEVETSNAKARTAAAGSDDPLRAGLDSLRHDNPPRPAAH
ncbi:hypothetical protein F1640_18310 [Novosphingobium sp. NBM11]|uniref:hypothetical protein n=1 Tax=Novosphingobium sp. NBM11 TaxID=2596914 RepID=UPI00189209AF|nr:hypothetical protein [Novosphingobium sp. NBM11]MBF5091909.1 hypothetical protein [Novosphingobium sp. NBM11]